ncbi:hypothetical protein [Flavobacterium aquicola]|uniref:Uncharacterized protein n=1 Tax=Flavobacterium aquicola TaxID=1682742 RepID=A0A3E0E975_9FLAO|nr:hypothetical protein [Flavobacterium aquicola]REG94798.1 hypothetical protein C8P67_11289 [Flavobacterium aquicola]
MKKLLYILLAVLALAQSGCQNDPLEDIEEGNWNNERNVLEIKFENQVGAAVVTRVDDVTGTINLAINVDAVPDLSHIVVQELVLSYEAKSSVNEGEALNFENAQKSATITITSPTGKSRNYTVVASSFRESLIGTYDIDNLVVYGGTGPEYGGGAVLALTDKPWNWSTVDGPAQELDNQLVFEMTGITEDGNTYGTVTNKSGADNINANFIYTGNPQTDVNNFYRQIPTGEGRWLRNYTNGTITFTFADGSTKVGTFESAGTEDLENGNKKTIMNNAFAFNLNGTDDWGSIYSDYDKFVKKPRRYWIDVTKQN